MNRDQKHALQDLLEAFRRAEYADLRLDLPDSFLMELQKRLAAEQTEAEKNRVYFSDLEEGAMFVYESDSDTPDDAALLMKLIDDSKYYNTVYLGTMTGNPDEPVLDSEGGDTDETEAVVRATPEQRKQAAINIDMHLAQVHKEYLKLTDLAEKVREHIGNSK